MKRGLTLIELAIAMAVLAVLSAIAVPGMAARLRAERLQSAAEMLAVDIADARHEAARRGSALHVEARADGAAWCWSVATQAACPCAVAADAPGAPVAPSAGQPSGCRLKTVPGREHPGVSLDRSQAVRLDAEGQASPVLAAVFSSGDRKLQVHVTRFGRARVCDPLGTSPKVARC